MWRRKPQRSPPTYEGVRLVAEVLSRINADLIARHFSISTAIATEYMARLVVESLFADMQADGWHYPVERQQRLRRAPVTRRSRTKSKAVDAVVDDANQYLPPLEADRIFEREEEVRALKARIKRLQNAGKTVIAQREEWRARALAGEELLEAECNRHAGSQDRFDALRRFVAKELHPDFCTGGQLEKLMRQECFKKLWPEIERLMERG
jgi:hypothetical protein